MTINLEQAKRLWELGVRKEAEKSWYVGEGEPVALTEIDAYHWLCLLEEIAPAYNAEELISMMQGDYEIRLNADKTVDITVWYERYKGYDYFKGNTLTEALAAKLIYDIENGIITAEEINK